MGAVPGEVVRGFQRRNVQSKRRRCRVNGMSSANWGQYSGPNGLSDWHFWGEDFATVEDCQTAAEALSGNAIAEIWYVPPYPGCPAGSCIGYCFPSESRCTNGDTAPSGGMGNKYYYNDI